MVSRLQYWFGNGRMGIINLLITAFCVFFSLSVHEFSHGYAAYKLGDNTAKYMGRLNLSPMSHIDPIGAICLFLFGFGWAKPVPINPANFAQNKRKSGMVITALAGPISNLLLAFVALLLSRIIQAFCSPVSSFGTNAFIVFYLLLEALTYMNIGLAIFNLIPIPPLDGSKVLNAVLPTSLYFRIMQYERYGFIVLLVLLNLPIFSNLMNSCMYGIYALYDFVIGLIPFL